jgi:hypothetical protein
MIILKMLLMKCDLSLDTEKNTCNINTHGKLKMPSELNMMVSTFRG